MYLKVSPTKGTVRFGFSRKIKLRYIGRFDIIIRIRDLTYELIISPSIDKVHNVCCISMLKKYVEMRAT